MMRNEVLDRQRVDPSQRRTVSFEFKENEVDHLREMVRQQLLGDVELLRDCLAAREDPEMRLAVAERLRFVRRLGDMLDLPADIDRRKGAHRQREKRLYGPVRRRLIRFLLR